MTENATDQTTSSAPDGQDTTVAERPAAPEGSVYLSDVLARVRQHADDNCWCSTAETVTAQVLNEGLSFKPLRGEREACGSLSCQLCYPAGVAEGNTDVADERFIATEGTAPLVTKARLKAAIRTAVDLGYDRGEPLRLFHELVDVYQLDEVPLPVRTYTVIFTVTDKQLRGRSADQSGVAYALDSGAVTGFAVSVESSEETAATLMP